MNTSPKKAMTLPELMLALLLSVAALGIGLAVLAASLDALGKMEIRQRLEPEARLNLERISRQIEDSQEIQLDKNTLSILCQDGSIELWQVAEIDGKSMLLHGTIEEIEEDPASQIALANVTAIEYKTEAISLTLSYKGQIYKFEKEILVWAKTLP